jgi:DNA polymerase I-like protein with 3'-5' exonuclease and polymerase domains
MVALAQRIPAGAHTVLTVHDELVVMCPEASGQQVSKIVQQVMTESMAQMFPSTRIEVEASVCRNWGEK